MAFLLPAQLFYNFRRGFCSRLLDELSSREILQLLPYFAAAFEARLCRRAPAHFRPQPLAGFVPFRSGTEFRFTLQFGILGTEFLENLCQVLNHYLPADLRARGAELG